jgi:hypothetical protein
VLLLGPVIGTGLLITRVAPGSGVEEAHTATVQWLAGERTETLDAVSGPAAELGNTWVVVGVALVAAILTITVLRRWRFALMFAVALVGELATPRPPPRRPGSQAGPGRRRRGPVCGQQTDHHRAVLGDRGRRTEREACR